MGGWFFDILDHAVNGHGQRGFCEAEDFDRVPPRPRG